MRITPRCPGPDRCSCVHCEGDDVYRSPTVLYDQRHPDQVAEPLHQSRGGEEVGRPGEIRREVLLPQGVFVAAEEGIGGFYDSDARPGAEEVARCHGETEERGDVGAVGFGPGWCRWSQSVVGWGGVVSDGMRWWVCSLTS